MRPSYQIMDELESINIYLRDAIHPEKRNAEANDKTVNMLKAIKIKAVQHGDQEIAKLVWCYEQILKVQQNYIVSFNEMKAGAYYQAWCLLERVRIEIGFLEPHCTLSTRDDNYKLEYIEKHTEQFQSLFPYKLFISPAFLYLEKKCSICDQVISLRNPCGHKIGEIYDGEMCSHVITKVDILEVSVVPNPVQKYSVLFVTDSKTGQQTDHYDYSLVKYAIGGLRAPFDTWDIRWTKIRHPHSLFEHISPNDNCPCDSGKKYQDCCLKEIGVLRPHVELLFSVPPPEDLLKIVYPEYRDHKEP